MSRSEIRQRLILGGKFVLTFHLTLSVEFRGKHSEPSLLTGRILSNITIAMLQIVVSQDSQSDIGP